MKQYITNDQLKELTEEQRDALGKYLYDKGYPLEVDLKGVQGNGYLLPLLSIGQMIEFLGSSDCLLNINQGQLSNKYYVYDRRNQDGGIFPPLELCDALWEAVKEILARKDSRAKQASPQE